MENFDRGGGGIFPREIEHRRRFLLSYANAWLKIQSFSSDRYSLHRAHVNIICSYARRIYRLSLHCHFHHESSAIILEVSSAGIIHDSAVYPKFCFHYFFVPVFFSRQTIFDRQDSPIFSKSKGGRGGGKKKCQDYGKFDNDSKIRSRLQKMHRAWTDANNRRIKGIGSRSFRLVGSKRS